MSKIVGRVKNYLYICSRTQRLFCVWARKAKKFEANIDLL